MICRADRLPPDVLIADDDPISRDILQHSLEYLGIGLRVQAVSDGYEALRAFSTAAAWIECVILDACMPGPCPQEMLDQLQRINPSVPVLFCSALADTDPSLEFILKRRLTLLMKPFAQPDLCQALGLVLGTRSSGHGS